MTRPRHTASVPDRLVEQQRIDDAVAREGVDHEPLLVGGDDLLGRRLEVEHALVDSTTTFWMKGSFDVQPGLGDRRAPARRTAATSACSVWWTMKSALKASTIRTTGDADPPIRQAAVHGCLPSARVTRRRAALARAVAAVPATADRARRPLPSPLVDDDLVRALQDLFHGLEIEALRGHVLGRLVGGRPTGSAAHRPRPRRRSAAR